jgi:hypothetical protein
MKTPNTTHPHYDTPLNVLAREIAAHFAAHTPGPVAVPVGADGEYFPHWAQVNFPADGDTPAFELNLSLRGYGTKKNEVTFSVTPEKATRREGANETGLNLPTASMDSTRERKKLFADLARRVLNSPDLARGLKEHAARVAHIRKRKHDLRNYLQRLTLEAPNADLWCNPRDLSNTGPAPLGSRAGADFRAHLYPDGSVSFDRISSLSFDDALKVFAILRGLSNA